MAGAMAVAQPAYSERMAPPTVNIQQVKWIGNDEVTIRGREFCPMHYVPTKHDGSKANPYWVPAPMASGYNLNTGRPENPRENPLQTMYLNGLLNDFGDLYKKKSYFDFQVCINNNGAWKMAGLETTHMVGIEELRKDMEALYNSRLPKIGATFTRVDVADHLCYLFHGVPFIKVWGNASPTADGSKEFPYQIPPYPIPEAAKKRIRLSRLWQGEGHYVINNMETYHKLRSPQELNIAFAAVNGAPIFGEKMPKLPSELPCKAVRYINGVQFIPIRLNNLPWRPPNVRPSTTNPFDFQNPGYYIFGPYAALVNSKAEFDRDYRLVRRLVPDLTAQLLQQKALMPLILNPIGPGTLYQFDLINQSDQMIPHTNIFVPTPGKDYVPMTGPPPVVHPIMVAPVSPALPGDHPRLAGHSQQVHYTGGFKTLNSIIAGNTDQSGENPDNPRPAWMGYVKYAKFYFWPALGSRANKAPITSQGMFNSANIEVIARASAAKP